MIARAYRLTGRLIWYTAWPIVKPLMSKTHRVYAVINNDDQVLLVKNWLGDGKWQLPGGGARRNESYRKTLTRELKEELRIVPNLETAEQLFDGYSDKGFKMEVYQINQYEGKVNRCKTEIVDVVWFHKNKLPKNINEQVGQILDSQ